MLQRPVRIRLCLRRFSLRWHNIIRVIADVAKGCNCRVGCSVVSLGYRLTVDIQAGCDVCDVAISNVP